MKCVGSDTIELCIVKILKASVQKRSIVVSQKYMAEFIEVVKKLVEGLRGFMKKGPESNECYIIYKYLNNYPGMGLLPDK